MCRWCHSVSMCVANLGLNFSVSFLMFGIKSPGTKSPFYSRNHSIMVFFCVHMWVCVCASEFRSIMINMLAAFILSLHFALCNWYDLSRAITVSFNQVLYYRCCYCCCCRCRCCCCYCRWFYFHFYLFLFSNFMCPFLFYFN